jgi:hypothetical protein
MITPLLILLVEVSMQQFWDVTHLLASLQRYRPFLAFVLELSMTSALPNLIPTIVVKHS